MVNECHMMIIKYIYIYIDDDWSLMMKMMIIPHG